jgi:serine/threonine protein kinase
VRLVGTYVIESELAILTYPCAEWNLEQFFQSVATASDIEQRSSSLRQFFTCLAKVLDFMHSFPLKHMDIKPQNLLVRSLQHSTTEQADSYKIYFTDFGISKSYPSLEESDTESWTSFTRTYAAKEVVLQETRGLSADIFSLGCVYAEMLAVHLDATRISSRAAETISTPHWNQLRSTRERSDSSLRPYHLACDHVKGWLSGLQIDEPELDAIRAWTMEMLNEEPSKRPSAREIADDPRLPFACLSCSLRTGPEEFEAADPIPCGQHVRHSNVEVPVAV